MNLEEAFEDWWRVNHPYDWFAAENNGDPVNAYTRLRLAEIIRNAYFAGNHQGMTRAAEICKDEKVDYASTGAEGDLAYNTAIEHAVKAILTERDKP